jgi:heterodisulfide reductase subunit C2
MDLKRSVKFEADRDPEFARWVSHTVGGERIRHCLQCGLCSGKCPLSLYMDYTPRRLMHLSREGFKEEVLGSSSIWLCTACYACMVNCPKNINVTHLLYALKQRAIEEKRYPHWFAIPIMAKQFSAMLRGSGRITAAYVALATTGNEQAWPEAVSYRPHATEERENPASIGD